MTGAGAELTTLRYGSPELTQCISTGPGQAAWVRVGRLHGKQVPNFSWGGHVVLQCRRAVTEAEQQIQYHAASTSIYPTDDRVKKNASLTGDGRRETPATSIGLRRFQEQQKTKILFFVTFRLRLAA